MLINMKNNFMKTLALALTATVLVACNGQGSGEKAGQASKTDENLSEFYVADGRPTPTAYLSLVDAVKTDSSMIYTAKSLNEKDTIGFKLEVINGVNAGVFLDGTINHDKGYTAGALKFSSIGKTSDNFVSALSGLYDVPSSGIMANKALLPLVFSSNKKNVDLTSTDTYTFKLFFDNKKAEEGQAFAVLDLYKRLFELRARDSTQYERIIAAFEGK